MAERVRLFLDVDGVINAQLNHFHWGKRASRRGTAQGFVIHWSDAMVDVLSSLDVELIWATTWREHAPTDIGLLTGYGLDARVLHPKLDPDAETTFPSIEWKKEAIRAFLVEEPGPWVQIDDELHYGHEEWGRFATDNRGLIVGPNPLYGISPVNIERIRQFIQAQE